MNELPRYPRDLLGHGRNPPHAHWPGQARVAVQFVLNYEEGGENSVLHGDAGSEQFLSEMASPPAFPARHLSMEGIYEYGSRVGVWRILREFEKRGLPLTVFGISHGAGALPGGHGRLRRAGARDRLPRLALDPLPERRRSHRARAPAARHGDHRAPHRASARAHHGHVHGLGWYTGRDSPNTRRLVADHGGFAYDSDYYGDDLPFWLQVKKTDAAWRRTSWCPTRWTATTCALRCRRATATATSSSSTCAMPSTCTMPKATTRPSMMSIGMHCRLLGRPGRMRALQRFLDHVQAHDRVWVTRRIDIARHWRQAHPFDASTAFVWE
jgi:allantoinase